MRKFFASFFGTLAAFAVLLAALLIGIGLLVRGASVEREAKPSLHAGSWLVFDLSDRIQDAPLQNEGFEDIARLFGQDEQHVLQARRLTRAIQAAAADDDIAGLWLSGLDPSIAGGAGYGALKEIRDAISGFRAAGKPVKAWLSLADTRQYYLASAADEVVLDPFGALLLPGLASQPMFYAGAMEKLGIGVQVTRVGKYKSAVEPFTRKDMSPESRLQLQKLLDDVWGTMVGSIEESRRLAPGALQKVADEEGLLRADDALSAHLVDRKAYLDEVLDELRASTGVKGAKESFRQISVTDYAELVSPTNLLARRENAPGARPGGHEKIAIVYAEGTIADGSGSEKDMVWGDKFSRQLRELRHDDAVKAVVLRVNSPGGSASASETIQREVRLLQKSKPLVVSMGSVAASGGYWISTYSDRIFAEPTTITGSIGVFGLLFNVQGLANDHLGLSFDIVKTGRFADAATLTRPKTPEELAIVQKHVDWIYQQFLSKVAESRRLEVATVSEIAQGRVWSGSEALRIGLVDELGGLEQAVAWAAAKAKVGEEFDVVEYPPRRPLVEAIREAVTGKRHEKAGTLGALAEQVQQGFASLAEYNDPRGAYARLPFDLALQ